MSVSLESLKRHRRINEAVKSFYHGGADCIVKEIIKAGYPKWVSDGTAAVGVEDGRIIFIFNPSFFDKLSLRDLMCVLYHESLHLYLHHLERGKGRNAVLVSPDGQESVSVWNIACDACINQMIKDCMTYMTFPEGAITMEFIVEALIDKPFIPENCSSKPSLLLWLKSKKAEEIYDLLVKNSENMSVSNDRFIYDNDDLQGEPVSCDATGDIFVGSDSTASVDPFFSDISKDAYVYGNSSGESNEMRRLIATYADKTVPWDAVLSKYMGSLYKPHDQDIWNTPSRKLSSMWPDVLLPHRDEDVKPTGCRILAAIDTSGSISDDLVEKFTSILNALPTDGYTVMYAGWNTKFRMSADLQEALSGSGGTDFFSVLKGLKDNKSEYDPDVVIVLSDGDWSSPSSVLSAFRGESSYEDPTAMFPEVAIPEKFIFLLTDYHNHVPKGSLLIPVGSKYR